MNDSRHDIERDAGELVADYARNGSVCDALYEGILGLLDRQAALTEREWDSATANERIAELQAKLAQCMESYADARDSRDVLRAERDELQAELDALRPPRIVEFAELESDEPQYDELLRCLEKDWHISASWDGLRKFWNVELTEEGVRLRDAELYRANMIAQTERVAELQAKLDEYDETHILLPVDADGVPIRLGDKMEYADGTEFEVDGIGSGGTLFSVDDASNSAWWTNAEGKRHAPERTVESVLSEFASRVLNSGHQWGLDAPDVVAEFAAELRELMGVDE